MWENTKAYKQRELWVQGKCTNLVASSLYANELRSLLRFCDNGLVVFVRTQFWQFCLRPSFGHINPTFLLCECTYRFPSSFDRFLLTLFSFGSYPHLTIVFIVWSFRLHFHNSNLSTFPSLLRVLFRVCAFPVIPWVESFIQTDHPR